MSVRQYIGARYVPLFIGEWTDDVSYEPLSIVIHEGNSFTSRQYVPIGIDISNEIYWAETGNFNSQVEQYRQEVLTFDSRIETNTDDIETLNSDLSDLNESVTDNTNSIEAINDSPKNNNILLDGNTTKNYFIGATTGSDDNKGTSDDDKLATIGKAFELAAKEGCTTIAIRIRENGIYEINDLCINNSQVHITPANELTNVTVEINELLYIYNSYIHISANNATAFTLLLHKGMHMDGCSFYFENIIISTYTSFQINMSSGSFKGCTIRLNDSCVIRPILSIVRFLTNTTIYSDNKLMLYGQASQFEFLNTFTIDNSSTTTGEIAFRFDECVAMVVMSALNVTKNNAWESFFGYVRSFGVVNSTALTVATNNATNAIGGSSSYIKTSTANTIE